MKIQITNLSSDTAMTFSLVVEDKGIFERCVKLSPKSQCVINVPDSSGEAASTGQRRNRE